MEYYAIDRVEGNYAVCEKDGETMVNISRALLPDGAGEGSVLRRLPDEAMTDTRPIDDERQLANPYDPSQGFVDDEGPMPVDPWEVELDAEPDVPAGFLDIDALRARRR